MAASIPAAIRAWIQAPGKPTAERLVGIVSKSLWDCKGQGEAVKILEVVEASIFAPRSASSRVFLESLEWLFVEALIALYYPKPPPDDDGWDEEFEQGDWPDDCENAHAAAPSHNPTSGPTTTKPNVVDSHPGGDHPNGCLDDDFKEPWRPSEPLAVDEKFRGVLVRILGKICKRAADREVILILSSILSKSRPPPFVTFPGDPPTFVTDFIHFSAAAFDVLPLCSAAYLRLSSTRWKVSALKTLTNIMKITLTHARKAIIWARENRSRKRGRLGIDVERAFSAAIEAAASVSTCICQDVATKHHQDLKNTSTQNLPKPTPLNPQIDALTSTCLALALDILRYATLLPSCGYLVGQGEGKAAEGCRLLGFVQGVVEGIEKILYVSPPIPPRISPNDIKTVAKTTGLTVVRVSVSSSNVSRPILPHSVGLACYSVYYAAMRGEGWRLLAKGERGREWGRVGLGLLLRKEGELNSAGHLLLTILQPLHNSPKTARKSLPTSLVASLALSLIPPGMSKVSPKAVSVATAYLSQDFKQAWGWFRKVMKPGVTSRALQYSAFQLLKSIIKAALASEQKGQSSKPQANILEPKEPSSKNSVPIFAILKLLQEYLQAISNLLPTLAISAVFESCDLIASAVGVYRFLMAVNHRLYTKKGLEQGEMGESGHAWESFRKSALVPLSKILPSMISALETNPTCSQIVCAQETIPSEKNLKELSRLLSQQLRSCLIVVTGAMN